ncbi:hypothetical protein BAE44_0012844 [Dichanthelium oligosanthes]|uniref:MATH domain-containing protein n=1 Tax=Dichanthelium oligosanthes TaxID=888268 RepID=A0A1E5VM34_9POAL|nr:hypothetical protein BAE44_0012844 [Dichanthelium oligosanthes]
MSSESKNTALLCTTEADLATYTYEFAGYSLTGHIGIGKFVRSDTFTVAGYDWAIRVYPDGIDDEASMDSVAASLELMSSDAEPEVFRALLHFIYNDSLPGMGDLQGNDCGEMMRHLFVAADRYAMDRMKLVCQIIICKKLDVETVATTLALADQHI